MADSLQFWIGLSSTLAPQVMLTKINSASLNLQLNNAGSVSIACDRAELFVSQLATPLQNCILIYRNGFLVWSGPIWTVSETYSGETKKLNVTAIGWFELLNHRLIRSQPGYLLQTSAITFSNGTFESAVSGWSPTISTNTRDTTNFHGGAGSFGWSQNTGTLFGTSKSGTGWDPPIFTNANTAANPFSATPTAGKRYKLNFGLGEENLQRA